MHIKAGVVLLLPTGREMSSVSVAKVAKPGSIAAVSRFGSLHACLHTQAIMHQVSLSVWLFRHQLHIHKRHAPSTQFSTHHLPHTMEETAMSWLHTSSKPTALPASSASFTVRISCIGQNKLYCHTSPGCDQITARKPRD